MVLLYFHMLLKFSIMFFGPCFQVEAIVDGFTTNNNLLKLLSSYDCCSQNNYFSKNLNIKEH